MVCVSWTWAWWGVWREAVTLFLSETQPERGGWWGSLRHRPGCGSGGPHASSQLLCFLPIKLISLDSLPVSPPPDLYLPPKCPVSSYSLPRGHRQSLCPVVLEGTWSQQENRTTVTFPKSSPALKSKHTPVFFQNQVSPKESVLYTHRYSHATHMHAETHMEIHRYSNIFKM